MLLARQQSSPCKDTHPFHVLRLAGHALGTPSPVSTTTVDRVLGRVAAGRGGQRVIIGGCEDNNERRAGRGEQDKS